MNKPEFKNIENPSYVVVDKDGKEKTVYHNRAVTVNIVQFAVEISEDKQDSEVHVLIGKRGPASHDFKGMLNLPCGHLDWNETITECAIRELFEETGFYDPNVRYELFTISSDSDNNRENVEITLIGHIEILKPEVLPEVTSNEETEEVHWEPMINIMEEYRKHQLENTVDTSWAFNHNVLALSAFEQYFGLNQQQEQQVEQ